MARNKQLSLLALDVNNYNFEILASYLLRYLPGGSRQAEEMFFPGLVWSDKTACQIGSLVLYSNWSTQVPRRVQYVFVDHLS